MIIFDNKVYKFFLLIFFSWNLLIGFAANAGLLDDIAELRKEHKEKIIKDVVKQLELTPNQINELKKEREAYKVNVKETRKELWLRIKKLKLELENQEANVKVVYNIAGEVKELRETLLYKRIDSILSMKKILTPEQYEKLQVFKKERVNTIRDRLEMENGEFGRLRNLLNQ